MTTPHKLPPARNLDIYRLIVLRNQQQQAIAGDFGVTRSRISQVVSRVHNWVNSSVGDWLFPGRDDLRFQVALELHQIRLFEHPENPQAVRLAGPNFTYTRAFDSCETVPSSALHQDTNVSSLPLNSPAQRSSLPLATTPSSDTTSPDPHLLDLGLHIARLLTIWRKSEKLSAAIRLLRKHSAAPY